MRQQVPRLTLRRAGVWIVLFAVLIGLIGGYCLVMPMQARHVDATLVYRWNATDPRELCI